MADPVNLNRFKKQKARADQKVRADQNAVKFGRTKAQKKHERDFAEKRARVLDGVFIAPDTPGQPHE